VRPAPGTIVSRPVRHQFHSVGWPASLGVAVLTGAGALVASGFVSSLAVDWYRISSFEGGSGFFVVGMALLGGIAGTITGLIAARVVAARPNPSFLKGLASATGLVLALLLVIGGVARVLADVPPEIDGEELMLLVELRSPAGDTTDLASLPGVPYVRLGALAPFSNVQRAHDQGPLWIDDRRREDNRWIVPGVVPIFTARGKKVIDAGVGDTSLMALLTPLPGSPSTRDREWSPWYPHAAEGAPPLPDQFTMRYRVVRQSDPVRTIKAGPFDIDLMIRGFYNVQGTDHFAGYTTFAVRRGATPVPGLERLEAVSIVAGPTPALVVKPESDSIVSECRLVTERNGEVNTEDLSQCASPDAARPLTTDVERYRTARTRTRLPGWLERDVFAIPGVYVFPEAILDTRSLTVRKVTIVGPTDEAPNVNVPVLGISPDQRSLAWYTNRSDDEAYIGVTDTIGGQHALLPIDRKRMRYANLDALDPGWLLHHFAWERDGDGVDRLVERKDVVPLPYHGRFSADKDYPNYQLEPAGRPLRAALEAWLVSELHAEALPGNAEPDAFSHGYLINGVEVTVMAIDTPGYVSVAFPTGKSGDPAVIGAIGKRFDEALATGKYDELFGRKKD
jgi:hypothetical protein